MAAHDPFPRLLGIEFVSGGLGFATVRLRIRKEHLNFNGTCHGGAIFTLADTAFGLAANAYGPLAAGIDTHITYQLAVMEGEVVTATATEMSRSKRLGVYRIDVRREDGALTSVFTGTVYISSRPTERPVA